MSISIRITFSNYRCTMLIFDCIRKKRMSIIYTCV